MQRRHTNFYNSNNNNNNCNSSNNNNFCHYNNNNSSQLTNKQVFNLMQEQKTHLNLKERKSLNLFCLFLMVLNSNSSMNSNINENWRRFKN